MKGTNIVEQSAEFDVYMKINIARISHGTFLCM